MSTPINPGSGYRLLEVGEVILPTDEVWIGYQSAWITTQCAGMSVGAKPIRAETYRRKISQPAGWVSVKERLPERQVTVIVTNQPEAARGNRGAVWSDFRSNYHDGWDSGMTVSHWLPLPEPTPPKSPIEQACDKYVSETGGDRDAFIAGAHWGLKNREGV